MSAACASIISLKRPSSWTCPTRSTKTASWVVNHRGQRERWACRSGSQPARPPASQELYNDIVAQGPWTTKGNHIYSTSVKQTIALMIFCSNCLSIDLVRRFLSKIFEIIQVLVHCVSCPVYVKNKTYIYIYIYVHVRNLFYFDYVFLNISTNRSRWTILGLFQTCFVFIYVS